MSRKSEERQAEYLRFQVLVDASRVGDVEAVGRLLDEGVDQNLDPGQPRGWSPLMTAAHAGHLEVVKLLVSRGAKMDTVEVDAWWNALDLAIEFDRPRIARYLRAKGAKRAGSRPPGK